MNKNKNELRQGIISDLELLLQAAQAKQEPQYAKVIGNIGQLKDSRGRNYYMNIPANRRATAQEIAQTFGKEETSSGQARENRDSAQRDLGAKVRTRKAAELMPGAVMSDKTQAEISDKAIFDKMKEYVAKEAELKVAQVGEKTYETVVKISDSLKSSFPSIHGNLGDVKIKEKFDTVTNDTIEKLKKSPIGNVTSFAQEKMNGLGESLSQAAGSSWEDVSNSPAFVETSASINGAIQAIQDKASPDTPQINMDISNLAFTINMAQAQLMFSGLGKDSKTTESGKALIEKYKKELTGLKPPIEQDTIQKLKEDFFKEFEKEAAKSEPTENPAETTEKTPTETPTDKTEK